MPMEILMSDPTTMFVCYRNGTQRTYPFAEASRLLWQANLGYVRLAQWYRYRIHQHEDWFSFPERRIKTAEAEVVFELHRRRCSPVTREDIFGNRIVSDNALTARVARLSKKAFSRLPAELDPIQPNGVPGDGRALTGYLYRSDLTYFMVHDLAWNGEIKRPYFDWAPFTVRPDDDEWGGAGST